MLSKEENAKTIAMEPGAARHTLFVLAQVDTRGFTGTPAGFWSENNGAFQNLFLTGKQVKKPVLNADNYKEVMRMEILAQLSFSCTALINQGVRPMPGDEMKVYWDGDKHGTFKVTGITLVNQSDQACRMILKVYFKPMLNTINSLP